MEQMIFAIIVAMLLITIMFLVFIQGRKDKQFTEERKDLLNRLMAKNIPEYVQVSKKDVKRPLTDGEILGDDRYNGILN